MNGPDAEPAVVADGVTFRYGDRPACDGISFRVGRGAVHGFLGPNGSGKSTLFKLLATIYPPQGGTVTVLGLDLATQAAALRRQLGVVFQSPALDAKLTVRENLVYGGQMYGLSGNELRARADEMLERTGLRERAADRVGELSGGLRRRTELAKGMLHRPRLLLLDEPGTGVDIGGRKDLWRFVRGMDEVTVLFTTHLMDEADQADRITILDHGKVVAEGDPDALKRRIGGRVLEVEGGDAEAFARELHERLGVETTVLGRSVRIRGGEGPELLARINEAFGDRCERLSLSHPSLEDVYIHETGHRFWDENGAEG